MTLIFDLNGFSRMPSRAPLRKRERDRLSAASAYIRKLAIWAIWGRPCGMATLYAQLSRDIRLDQAFGRPFGSV